MSERAPRRLMAEIAGWYGTISIVGAYIGVSFSLMSPTGAAYQLLNLTGALGIVVISTVKRVRQSVVLNLFWALIALVALAALAVKH